MSKATTFKRVDAEIAAGDLGKARDRLEGLLVTYPADLEIRRRLGEIYLALQYPDRAGKYLYLEDDERAEVLRAKDAFERRNHRNAQLMLSDLAYRGGLEAIAGTYAESVLRGLLKDARIAAEGDKAQWFVGPREPGEPPATFNDRLTQIGCITGLVVLLVLLLIGAATVVGWVVSLLR